MTPTERLRQVNEYLDEGEKLLDAGADDARGPVGKAWITLRPLVNKILGDAPTPPEIIAIQGDVLDTFERLRPVWERTTERYNASKTAEATEWQEFQQWRKSRRT